ncbi:lateral flagellin LafA [Pseudomonas saudiphocaensis]|uniref:Flagellin n=1 Tax=Pseudomonas saudiphocaensis TaxID=1499686 RepID=A0A078LYG6_9PSED|nr:lateral flagellin LafA [Pseudomonas saudiphocaensis]CDZ95377.1 flagellin domain-containing protein [Pseudomonas saudiphocaensis]
MALSIHTNYSSLIANTNLNKTNNALSVNQQRLSTGLRINSAADDAAGLQIATRLNAQSRGMAVASRNSQDAISMMQTAEGALNEYTDIVQRMKDLALQAANGTNGTNEYTALDAEFSALKLELKNIEDNTAYGAGTKLLTGGKFAAAITFQIGTAAADDLEMDVSADVTALTGAASGSTQAGIAAGIGDQTKANTAVDQLDTLLGTVGTLRGKFGANINRLNHTINNLANMRDNTEMGRGRIMDADFAVESANMSKNSMLMQSGISMLKQAGQMPGMVMGLLG